MSYTHKILLHSSNVRLQKLHTGTGRSGSAAAALIPNDNLVKTTSGAHTLHSLGGLGGSLQWLRHTIKPSTNTEINTGYRTGWRLMRSSERFRARVDLRRLKVVEPSLWILVSESWSGVCWASPLHSFSVLVAVGFTPGLSECKGEKFDSQMSCFTCLADDKHQPDLWGSADSFTQSNNEPDWSTRTRNSWAIHAHERGMEEI